LAPGAHPFDLVVAWLARRSKLFSLGWGDETIFARSSDSFSYSARPRQSRSAAARALSTHLLAVAYMTLIRGGDEAGRDPAIEPADDTFSIVTQEPDELLLVLRLDGQGVDKGGDLFRHLYGRVHDVLL
jgi:hypothetical protein